MGFLRISKTISMLAILCFAKSASADVQEALANLADENLRACVAEQVDTNLKASEVTKIECGPRDITDLSGLSAFVGLNYLFLASNKISDLAPLETLTNMEFLQLSHNLIVNVSPLAGLTNVTALGLTHNLIEDVSPLSNLTSLESLTLSSNSIQDISPLGNLTRLEAIKIDNNGVEDLSVLASFTDLRTLGLDIRSDNHFNVLNSLTELVALYVFAREYRLPSYEIFSMDGLRELTCDCRIENLKGFLSALPSTLNWLEFSLDEGVTDLDPFLNLPQPERFWVISITAPGVTNIDFLLNSGFPSFNILDSGVECSDAYRVVELSRATGGIGLFATGCYGYRTFDVDGSQSSQPLTDGLLAIRHLFGFSGSALTSGAVAANGAERFTDERISEYLGWITRELDIDDDGQPKPLTDGLLLIRYLFGFRGDSLISGAIGDGAKRNTAEKIESYIEARTPRI